MFSVDEKVVCIHTFSTEGREIARSFGEKDPIKGEMYTIRDIESREDGVYLRFHELINPRLNYIDGCHEAQFWSERFRKLDYDFVEEVMAMIKEVPAELSEGVVITSS